MMNHNQVKLTDSQNAFAYAIYMMVSSNFKDAVCDSRITEEWLHFQYKQQKGAIQDQMADMCAAYADTYLTDKLPEHIWNERVCVTLDRDYHGLKRIIVDGKDFTMDIHSTSQRKGRAVVICRFKYLGEVKEYMTSVRHYGQEDVTFREPDIAGKQRQTQKPAPVRERPVKTQVKAEKTVQKASRIRNMLARALADGILKAPEYLRRAG